MTVTTDNAGGDAGIGSAELGMMPSPTDDVTQDVAEIMFQLYLNKYD